MKKIKKLDIGEVGFLSELVKGQRGKVLELNNNNLELRRRLLDMGITRGVEVEVKKISPMGDPVDISLRGYELCIRLNDLNKIKIEVIA